MPKEEKGYWFSTENGTHIHAEEGESKESAMKKKFSKFGKKEETKKDSTFEEINEKRMSGKTKKHNYSEIFDEDYQRSWGIPDFKDENDIKTLNDIVEKAMEYDGEEGAIDISNNAMERIEELVKFSPEEQDKLASGTGEEIMDILRSKEKKELTFEGAVKNADDDVLDEQFGKDTPERKLIGAMKEQKPSLKERRKEWEKNLGKSGDEYQKRTGELYQKLRNGEIGRKEYNQEFKKIQEDYQKANAFPQRDRLAVDDEIEGYEKQFKSIKEQLDPLEDEDNKAFNRHLMFNEPYDESKKNPKIAELNTQLKDVMGKRTDARRRLAKELGSQFGRKDYRNEIDSGKLPSGNDRVYAMYQKSLEEPYLDFSRMIANDVSENVKQYPKKLEFEDDLYEISESGRAFDHYKKENGEWQHISTGTISALGKDLGRRLEEENLKSTESKSGKVEPSKLAKSIKTIDDVKSVFGKYLNEEDVKKLDNSKNLYIEISKQYDGDDNFQIIDDERIKKGHNFGNGTIKDFQEYMKNNKDYAHFIKLR